MHLPCGIDQMIPTFTVECSTTWTTSGSPGKGRRHEIVGHVDHLPGYRATLLFGSIWFYSGIPANWLRFCWERAECAKQYMVLVIYKTVGQYYLVLFGSIWFYTVSIIYKTVAQYSYSILLGSPQSFLPTDRDSVGKEQKPQNSTLCQSSIKLPGNIIIWF